MNREDLNNTINQLDLKDIYRTLYQATVEATFVSSAHGAFSRINYMLGHKQISMSQANHKQISNKSHKQISIQLNRSERIQSIFSKCQSKLQ